MDDAATPATIKILDASGAPMNSKPPKMLALAGNGIGGNTTYDSANMTSQRMADWNPYLTSPDQELNVYRDRIVSRSRDLTRNDGWASGAITRTLDNIIGGSFRPLSKPDYKALAEYTGNSKFDAVWAEEYGKAMEANYRAWANDPNFYCDAQRTKTVADIMYLGFRHYLVDGDSLATVLWRPGDIGRGKARYATSIQLIDPDRLSNPQKIPDTFDTRGGVKVDKHGAPLGYYIRRAHQGDWYNAADAMTWDLLPRETSWGRPIVIHFYTADRAGQHRGGLGILNPIMERMKMLTKYDGAELDQAVINAMFGAYIESPFDPEIVKTALGGDENLGIYQEQRAGYHRGKNITLGGARMPHLFPGEKIQTVKAEHPASAFADFQATFLRNMASAVGLSYEQISSDWSKSNYSSARGAIVEAWKTLSRRRTQFTTGFANPVFSSIAEEIHDVDKLPVPSGAPGFDECRGLYGACRWLGPARGTVDPTKETQASMLGMAAGLTTLEAEAAAQGSDWETNLDQRKAEVEAFEERGLDVPAWGSTPDTVTEQEKVG